VIRTPSVLGLLLIATALGSVGTISASASTGTQSSAGSTPRTLPSSCSDNDPCHYRAGTYRLGPHLVLPGLRLTLPGGWWSTETTNAEVKLIPPGPDDEELHLWIDMHPVKSTGTGHGSILRNVGTTPKAILSWLTSNPDFTITSKPTPVKIAGP
jgi:hypothetical protein